MSGDAPLAGRCLCGACTFTAVPKTTSAMACHCGQCRQWAGGIFVVVPCGTSVRFAEGAPVQSFCASDWGERLFCGTCGSSLVWQMQGGTHQNVAISAFADPGQFRLTREVFHDCKPESYALAGETETVTEAEVMAALSKG